MFDRQGNRDKLRHGRSGPKIPPVSSDLAQVLRQMTAAAQRANASVHGHSDYWWQSRG